MKGAKGTLNERKKQGFKPKPPRNLRLSKPQKSKRHKKLKRVPGEEEDVKRDNPIKGNVDNQPIPRSLRWIMENNGRKKPKQLVKKQKRPNETSSQPDGKQPQTFNEFKRELDDLELRIQKEFVSAKTGDLKVRKVDPNSVPKGAAKRRLQKLQDRKQNKRLKSIERQLDDEVKHERIAFGERVDAPPTITAVPRGVASFKNKRQLLAAVSQH